MERDRKETDGKNQGLLRIIKGIVWLIIILFGGFAIAVGTYILTLDDRLKSQIEGILSRSSLFDVTIGDLHAELSIGRVVIHQLRMAPDWGQVDQITVIFDPKKLKKPGKIVIDKLVMKDGNIRHWGKLAFIPLCPINLPETPGGLRLTINQIDWQNIEQATQTPWPDYVNGQKPVTFQAGAAGVCRVL